MPYVRVREVAQAMIDDATPKARRTLVREPPWRPQMRREYNYRSRRYILRSEMVNEDTVIVGSTCAIGGAAVTLGLNAEQLERALLAVPRDGVQPRKNTDPMLIATLGDIIIDFNDTTGMPKAEIGRLILEQADEKTLNTRLRVDRKDYLLLKRKAAMASE